MECYQNGKRFTFRQNDDILRASSIIGGDTDGKSIERYIRCWEGIVGIVVTIISIIVTLISIVQTAQKHKHQKSNRPRQE